MNRTSRIEISKLGKLTRLGSGGQGVVYSTQGRLDDLALPLVYKEYKPQVLNQLDVRVLEGMPAYLASLERERALELLSISAWPCRIVEKSSQISGFLMPVIPAEFFFEMQKSSGPDQVVGEFQHLLNSEGFLARRRIPVTDRHRYELLASTAEALSIFHGHDVVVGDLSPKNLLFSLQPEVRVFFIDSDAMRFDGLSVSKQLETPGWGVLEVNSGEELATPKSDAFKLGLMALRLLTGDQSTRDIDRLPDSVPRKVVELIRAATLPDPDGRPEPRTWVAELRGAARKASTELPQIGASDPSTAQLLRPTLISTMPSMPTSAQVSKPQTASVPTRQPAALPVIPAAAKPNTRSTLSTRSANSGMHAKSAVAAGWVELLVPSLVGVTACFLTFVARLWYHTQYGIYDRMDQIEQVRLQIHLIASPIVGIFGAVLHLKSKSVLSGGRRLRLFAISSSFCGLLISYVFLSSTDFRILHRRYRLNTDSFWEPFIEFGGLIIGAILSLIGIVLFTFYLVMFFWSFVGRVRR